MSAAVLSRAMRPDVVGVFLAFLRLGVTSFGGPIAHLGYFRADLVERRHWLDDRRYADLVALCQFLPGPASSQVGFGIGLARAGAWGALAAFAAFTLPSAVVMIAVAAGANLLGGDIAAGALTGLGVVAVAVVAQAVGGMARSLTPDAPRAGIAVVAAGCASAFAGAGGQIVALVIGASAGLWVCRSSAVAASDGLGIRVSRCAGILCLVAFAVLLVGLPIAASATADGTLQLADAFYRAGALVFGGGHVVLPLLQASVVDAGWVSPTDFLTGYAVAQALPGPLFAFAAYLGFLADTGPGGVLGAAVALIAVFLPGFLLLVGALPLWSTLRRAARAQAAMRGTNAAVVGVLAAALYDPVFVTAVVGPPTFTLALLCFVLLVAFRAPPWAVVLVGAVGGVILSLANV